MDGLKVIEERRNTEYGRLRGPSFIQVRCIVPYFWVCGDMNTTTLLYDTESGNNVGCAQWTIGVCLIYVEELIICFCKFSAGFTKVASWLCIYNS